MSVPNALLDAFGGLLGRETLRPLRRLAEAAPDSSTLASGYLNAFAYSLPEVTNTILDPLAVGVPEVLVERELSNVFLQNPSACAIAALIVIHQERNPTWTARRLSEAVVPSYLSFATIASSRVVEPLRALLDRTAANPPEQKKADFTAVVQAGRSSMNEALGDDLTRGLQHLIEAVQVARDKRIEESPLTLDIRLPLTASWALVVNEVSRGGTINHPDLLARQNLLRRLPTYSAERLIDELEAVGQHLGRGVARMALREKNPENGQGFFVCEELWKSHAKAPFSRLYGLDWMPSTLEMRPDVRVVLLPNSGISVYVEDDPFFEYLLGHWRYVDIRAKTRLIASLVAETEEVETAHGSLFRIARMAHHLGYHNHGAILDVNLGDARAVPGKLAAIKARWTIEQIEDDGLPLPDPPQAREENELAVPGYGRFAYVLALQDGATTWALDSARGALRLRDFGEIMELQAKTVDEEWKKYCEWLGAPSKLGGARHRAALFRSLEGGDGHLVFCISQDGYIDLYSNRRTLRLR